MEGEREAKNPRSLLLPGRQSGERGKGGEEARNRQVEKFEHFPLLFHFSAVVTGSSPAAAGAGARSAATRHFLGLRWGPFPSFAPFCFEEEKGRQEIQAPKTASIVSGEMVKKKKKKAPKKRKTSWISVKAPSLVTGDWQTAHSLPRPWLEGSMGSGKAGGRGPLRIPTLLISPAELRTLRSQDGCMGCMRSMDAWETAVLIISCFLSMSQNGCLEQVLSGCRTPEGCRSPTPSSPVNSISAQLL
ncbi:uncharacterized protein LOC120322942 [Pipra filicauda]|uniref:Uncharacterized protein LOC120322942 n=1 Tax=Pipra filicauda TaxID=649802 RepID=A0A7R5K2W0_9PASS|nr:uncharacterized protein LOC120322942 [Pipra filicauda]